MRFKLIACEILFRECSFLAAQSPHRVDVSFLPQGLHDLPGTDIGSQLQQQIDLIQRDTEENHADHYDAILLGYGLCNNAIIGLRSTTTPIIVPRANDCIALFFGDRHRFAEYFHTHPGTYYKTGGWIERGGDLKQYKPGSFQQQSGLDETDAQWEAKYGPENAAYLRQQFSDMYRHYSQLTFIRVGLGPEDRFQKMVEQEAEKKNWHFDSLDGDMTLLADMINGNWDAERFLLVPPGKTIRNTYDANIVGLCNE